MMVKQNQVHVLLVLTATFIHGVFSTQAPCPGGVATLNTEYIITGDRSNYTGFVWQRPGDDRYVVTCNTACSPVAGYNATNDTDSTLTIHSVKVNDAGTWKIVDANVVDAPPVDVCHLTAASPPQCNISSDTDTDVLEPGTNLTLTVDIRGYFCSQEAVFDLTTGSVTDVLLQNQTTHNVTDTVQHHFFNVSSDRLGNVSVMFRCDNSYRSLTCDGVSKLSAAPSPTTSLTSTAAPSPTTSPTPSGTRNTSPSSPTVSERSSTPTSPTTTESSPSDLTLGLAIGLPLLFCVIAVGIALCFYRERLKKIGRYIVQRSPDKSRNAKCHEMRLQQPIQDNLSS